MIQKLNIKFLIVSILFSLFCLYNPFYTFASDEIFDTWVNETDLPFNVASHQSLFIEGQIYVLGGAGKSGGVDIGYNKILNSDTYFSPLAWNEALQSLPEKLLWHNITMKENSIYVLGGAVFNPSVTNSTNKVFLANFNPVNKDFEWSLLSPLPENLSSGGAVIFKNYIYYIGGFTKNSSTFTFKKNIFRAQILEDNTLSSWTKISELPTQLSEFALFLNGNKLIVLGGASDSTFTPKSTAIYTTINDDGTLSTWNNLLDLPVPIRRPGFTKIGNYMILAGGVSTTPTFLDSVYYSQMDSEGLPTSWIKSVFNLPTAGCCSNLTGDEKALYYIAGLNGSGYSSSVYKTTLLIRKDGPFELPFDYQGRGTDDEDGFKNAFWSRRTALFDHEVEKSQFTNFLGNSYILEDCYTNTDACYDSHNGIDFDDTPTNIALPVASGQVVFRSENKNGQGNEKCMPEKSGYGCVVIIRHDTENNGEVFGLYAHLQEIYVDENEYLDNNQPIGLMGATGAVTGTHLHFGAMYQLPQTGIASFSKMKKSDWKALIDNIADNSAKSSKLLSAKKSYCTYTAPNGSTFAFFDPSGWSGESTDPFSLSKEDGGCGIESTLLWKYSL